MVDNDPAYIRLVQRSMRHCALAVDLVSLSSAEGALAYMPEHVVDLIVLDVFMPEINGVEACRRLRAAGIAAPVAVVSWDMTSEIETAAFDAGATYTFDKGFDLPALIRVMEAAIAYRQQLIAEHFDLARNIARRLARRYASMISSEDIEGPAMVGLCEAAARFDPSRVEPFVAFAEQRIRGAVLDEVRRSTLEGRIVHKRQKLIAGARRALAQRGDEPTDEGVAKHLGLDVSSVQRARARTIRVTADVAAVPSLDASPAAQVEYAEVLACLNVAREALPEPEATVIGLYYDSEMSLATIARTLELPHARVAQLHATGVAMLRSWLQDHESRDSEL